MKSNKRIEKKRQKIKEIAMFLSDFYTRRRVRYVVVAGRLRRIIEIRTEIKGELSKEALAALEFLESQLL